MSEKVLDISWTTIVRIFVAGLIFYVLYLARDIALWFFFALVISVLLEPAIKFLRKIYIPRVISIILVYFSIFGILGLLIYLTTPIFIFELKQFTRLLPEYIENIIPLLNQLGFDFIQNFQSLTSFLVGNLEKSSKSVISALLTFFGGIYSGIFILTLALFLSLQEGGVKKVLVLLVPKKHEEYIASLFETSQRKVSGWFGARVLACFFVGVASFIFFFIFDVKYSFILSLLAGVLNFVPYVGPLVTAVLLFLSVIVSSGSWVTVIYVLIVFFVIQMIEGNLLTPVLMKRMIDLPPILVLLALLVGSQIFGFLGMIFSVPVFGIIYEVLKEFLEKRKEEPGAD